MGWGSWDARELAHGWTRWTIPLALLLCAGSRASAQVPSSPLSTVAVTATKPGRLTLSVTANQIQSAPSIIEGGLTNFGPGPVSIVTQWDVKPGQTASVRLVGYFSSAAAALSDGLGNDVPSSEMEAQMSTVAGMPWTAFTQNAITAGTTAVGTAGASLLFWTVPITGTNKKTVRSDQLALRLNLTARTTPLPAGAFTGTLFLRAVAF